MWLSIFDFSQKIMLIILCVFLFFVIIYSFYFFFRFKQSKGEIENEKIMNKQRILKTEILESYEDVMNVFIKPLLNTENRIKNFKKYNLLIEDAIDTYLNKSKSNLNENKDFAISNQNNLFSQCMFYLCDGFCIYKETYALNLTEEIENFLKYLISIVILMEDDIYNFINKNMEIVVIYTIKNL